METSQAPIVQTKPKLPGVIDLIKQAWEIYKEKFVNIIGIMAIPFVLQLLLGIRVASFFVAKGLKVEDVELYIKSLSKENIVSLLAELFAIITPNLLLLIIVGAICSYGLTVLIVKRKNGFGIKESLSQAFNQFFKIIWTNILIFGAIFCGFLFFIIPGFLFAIWFLFSQYILADQDIAGTKSLSKSKNYVSGIMGDIVGIFSGLILASVIASIALSIFPKELVDIINAVVVSPMILISFVLLYENVKAIKEPKQNPEITL